MNILKKMFRNRQVSRSKQQRFDVVIPRADLNLTNDAILKLRKDFMNESELSDIAQMRVWYAKQIRRMPWKFSDFNEKQINTNNNLIFKGNY